MLDDEPVATDLVIGANAAKPLRLEIPIFVSDMSFGALSQEAKVALVRGAELAGTGIASGEGGEVPAGFHPREMRIHPGDLLPSAQARSTVEKKPLRAFGRGAPAQTSASRNQREEYG